MPAGFSSIVRTSQLASINSLWHILTSLILDIVSLQGGNNVTDIQGMVIFYIGISSWILIDSTLTLMPWSACCRWRVISFSPSPGKLQKLCPSWFDYFLDSSENRSPLWISIFLFWPVAGILITPTVQKFWRLSSNMTGRNFGCTSNSLKRGLSPSGTGQTIHGWQMRSSSFTSEKGVLWPIPE